MNSKSAVSYNTLRKKPLHYINEKFKSGKPVFSLANNLHIANQKGLFIYNNSSKLPFEEVILKNWTLHFIGNMSQGRKMFRTPLICFNFHKSIGYSLKRKLTEIGIIKENIFSKPETIAKKAVPKLLNTLK